MAVVPDMIGLVVEDINESLAFYRLLGLNIPDDETDEDFFQIITPNGYRISWNKAGAFGEGEVHSNGRVGVAYLCGSPMEVDAIFARLIGAGYTGKTAPWDAFWGQRYAQVLDPDGITVDLFAPSPAG